MLRSQLLYNRFLLFLLPTPYPHAKLRPKK